MNLGCIQLDLLGIKTMFPISKIRGIASYWHMCMAYICSCGASPLSYINHRTHVHKISSNLIYPLNISIRVSFVKCVYLIVVKGIKITSDDRVMHPQIRLILIWVQYLSCIIEYIALSSYCYQSKFKIPGNVCISMRFSAK